MFPSCLCPRGCPVEVPRAYVTDLANQGWVARMPRRPAGGNGLLVLCWEMQSGGWRALLLVPDAVSWATLGDDVFIVQKK